VISSYISVGVIFLYFSHRQFIPRTSVFLLELGSISSIDNFILLLCC
jgi:hypothetical protein